MIIHKIIYSTDHYPYNGKKQPYYLCIQACSTTKAKSSYLWNKVTCQNCRRYYLKFLEKKWNSLFK